MKVMVFKQSTLARVYKIRAFGSRIGYLSFFTRLTSWLRILSGLRKPGIAAQKYIKNDISKFKFS